MPIVLCSFVSFYTLSLMPIGYENTFGNLEEVTDNDLKLSYAAVRPDRKPIRNTSHMLKSRWPNPNHEAVGF